ncbi:Serine/threonine kinase mps1 [Rhodotorula sphaerocarpa]
MSNGPATPSSGSRGSNALGRLFNKLRTPTASESPLHGADEQPRPPSRSSSPFGSLMGRRSSSRASVRTMDSQHSAVPAPPPFPASLNNSSLSLASRYASLDTPDDADLSFPEFETNPFGLSPSSTSLASTSGAPPDSAPFSEATLQARPPTRPGTSMSTRSRNDSSLTDDAAGAAASGWPSSLSSGTNASGGSVKESLGASSRTFGRSLLGKRKDAGTSEEPMPAMDESLAAKQSFSRAPLTRTVSDDPARALATTTPAVPREALSSSSTASSDPRRMFGTARPAGTAGMRRARRVVQTAQPQPSASAEGLSTPESQGTLADAERSAASVSSADVSASNQSPLEAPAAAPEARTSRETSPNPPAVSAPAPKARPPISPNAHGRSRSELPPSSPRMALPTERNASTVTISAADRNGNPASYRQPQQRNGVPTPPEAVGSTAPLFSSRAASASAAGNGPSQLQPLGSTAFRNRFLNSSSASSLSSSNNNSPELGSVSHLSSSTSATSNGPSPPVANGSVHSGAASGAGGFKLAPLGQTGGLPHKPSISMLSAVAEDRPHGSAAAAEGHPAPIDTRQEVLRTERAAKPPTDLGRANLDERRMSTSNENDGMVPYAHRRSASRTAGPGNASILSESMSTGSGTNGGTTLVNTANGVPLKRSNSETVTQGMMGPPASRPSSMMSLYRDDPAQQAPTARPAVSRVPSGRQALAQRPTVAEIHPEPQEGYPQPPSSEPPQQASSAFQPYQDENVYDPRAAYGRPDGPLPPPPQGSMPPPHGSRPVLAEVNRGYGPSAQPPQTQQRSTAPLYSLQTAQKPAGEYQVPLRDRSPGLAEATPSATMQQAHYQGQQGYQQRHPHMQHVQQPYQHQQHQQHQQSMPPQGHAAGVSFAPIQEPPTAEKKTAKPIVVNGRTYMRCGILGRGGSSKVFRVLTERNDVLALKRVDTRNDSESRSSFINEITLLRKLAGKPEIIQLVDSEIQGRHVIMVMEAGETDLNTLLGTYAGKPTSLNFIRYIWEQMLSAVQVIHDEAVVHSDLKPANFVLVKGRLKLIDFGISKAIAGDTTNIGRDQQIGTANYMPPEALNDTGLGLGGKRLMKLGRAADVWSLGCILYQMVYGRPPFSHIRDIAIKIAAISSPSTKISFPEYAVPRAENGEALEEHKFLVGPDLLATLKSCLRFEPKQRASIPDLLNQPFLRRTSGDSARPDLPYISRGMMDAIVQRVSDKVRGPRNPISELDLMDIAQELMSEVWNVQDTLPR